MECNDPQLWKKSEKELWQDLLVGHGYAALLFGGVVAALANGRLVSGPGWGASAFLTVLTLIDCWLAVAYLAELRRRGSWVPPGVWSHPYVASIGYSLAFLACASGVIGLLLGVISWLG